MTTTRQRLEALDDLVRTTGKPREEILRKVAPTWGLSLGELSVLREKMASTPEPKPARVANGSDPRALADQAHARSLADRTVADINAFRSWRNMKEQNPHAAAVLLNRNAEAIMRGRALDTEPPEPPQAA